MKKYYLLFIVVFFLIACGDNRQPAFTGNMPKEASTNPSLAGQSLYQLTDTFQTQDGNKILLSSFEGAPTLVAMIFTHCTYACPRITADMQQIAKGLGENKDNVNYVLVSFDVERDSAEVLKVYAEKMGLQEDFWTLLHGDDDAVRMLSVLLNVDYLKNSNGDFSHSNIISLLDAEGILQFQQEGLDANPEQTISKIKAMLGEEG